MKTSFQIWLDKRAGSFLNLMLFIPVRILGIILRINHNLDRQITRIVVAKYKGMGSIVQSSGLLAALREKYPTAEIVFLSTKANSGILNYYSKFISKQLLIDDSSILRLKISSIRALFNMWKFRPQLFIDLEVYSNYGTLMCTLSAATNRMGFYKSDKDYRTGLYTHLMVYNIKAPLSEIYMQTARMLGIGNLNGNLPYLNKNTEAELNLFSKFPGLKNQKFFIINPNASDLRLERRWPAGSFVNLISQLIKEYPEHYFVLVGNKAEKAYVSEISNIFKGETRVADTSSLLNLTELIELIRNSETVITNDTGPLHLSLALQKNTVGLFGPCSPTQYGQMQFCTPVYMNLYCSPCVHEFLIPPCGGNNRCMKDIQVENVLAAIRNSFGHAKSTPVENIIYTSENQALGFVKNRKK